MNKNLIRHKITYEAAMLIAQMGIYDFQYAKTKAAKKFHINDIHLLPSNEEILEELKNFHALFKEENNSKAAEDEDDCLSLLVKIMRALEPFKPRLAEYGIDSNLIPHNPIEIYITAAALEEVSIFLLDRKIPYHIKEKKIILAKNKTQQMPYFDLYKEKYKLQIIFLTQQKHPIRPFNSFDNKPLQFLNTTQIEAKLNS